MGLSNNLGKLSNMITSTGSAVGIAQTSPSYTLDVTGTGRYTSDIIVNGHTFGRGGGSAGNNDLAIGANALSSNTTGTNNTAGGNSALGTNTTGSNNTAFGSSSLTPSNGSGNSAFGFNSLGSNTSGSYNTVIGYNSGSAITTGSNNTIVGNYAGTTTMANNIVLADGAGNIRYQWNGTTNNFTGAATFSSSVTATQGKFSGSRPQGIFTENGTSGLYLRDASGSSYKSWSIGTNDIVVGFAITPSTAAGGTTFTTPAFVINESGNVGIGTSSLGSWAKLQVAGNMAISGTGYYFSNDFVGGVTPAWLEYNYTNGNLDLGSYGPSANGYIRFIAGGTTERMRITSSGWFKAANNGVFLNINGNYHELTTSISDNIFIASNYNSTPYGPYMWFVNAAPNNTSQYFLLCDDSVNSKAAIYSNGTFGSRTGTYGSIISDIKYKQDITDASSQWDDIKKLRVVNFKYKEDVELEGENALRQIGFIAQEVELVSPNLVYESGKKDSEETWKSVKTSIIHLKAVKALQEAMARIEQLEAKVTALENR